MSFSILGIIERYEVESVVSHMQSNSHKHMLWLTAEDIIGQLVPYSALYAALGKSFDPPVVMVPAAPCPVPFKVFQMTNITNWSFWEDVPGTYSLSLLPTMPFPAKFRGVIVLVVDSRHTTLEGTGVLWKQRQHLSTVGYITAQLDVPLLIICLGEKEDDRSSDDELIGDLVEEERVTFVYVENRTLHQLEKIIVDFCGSSDM